MFGPDSKRLVIAIVIGSGLGLGGATAALAADFDIDAHWDKYEQAVVAADADAWLALWDSEGLQMRPDAPARTYDTLVVEVPKGWADGNGVSAMNIDSIDFEVAGEWAFSRGEYNFTVKPEGKEVTKHGKFLTILKRQEDGSFKIYRDCFNMNGK